MAKLSFKIDPEFLTANEADGLDEVNSKLVTALSPIPAYPDEYDGNDTEYTVFSYYTTPAEYYDDKPHHEVYHVSVKYVAPIGKNALTTRRSIKNALFDAGFTYPEETNISERKYSEKKYQIYLYECEYLGETGL